MLDTTTSKRMSAQKLEEGKQVAEAKKAMEEQQQAQTAEMQNLLTATKAESEKAKTENMNVQTQLMGTNVLKNIGELSKGEEENGENES